jgi:hypothetical protein
MTLVSSRKVLVGGLAAAVFATSIAASTQGAEAGWRHRNYGGAVAAGVIGGLAVGALAATAARPAYGYGYPAYGYGGGYYPSTYYRSGYYGGYASDYYAPAGVAGSYYGTYDPGPACYWTRRRVAVDPYTVVIRRVQVCE